MPNNMASTNVCQLDSRSSVNLFTAQNGRNLTFKPVQLSKKIIQVLHVKNHWITISNIGASNIVKCNVVYVFDSLQSTSLDLATKKQICCLTRPNNGTMTIDFVSLVRQQNSSDCGVCVLAYAMEIAAGHDPSSAVWDNDRMRKHLIHCFEQGRMSRFPIQRNRRIPLGRRIQHSTSEGIYCICRMPNDESMPMIMCGLCHRWFHSEYVQVDIEEYSTNKQWQCDECHELFR